MRILFKAIPILFIMLGLLLRPMHAMGDSGHDALLRKAYELKTQYKETEALAVYEQILQADSQNLEALSQASILHSRMGDRYADDSRKQEHFDKARSYASLALLHGTADARANYAMALALASAATISGPKLRLQLIGDVKPYLNAALAADSSQADAWHLLGRWAYKMANLNFAEVATYKVMLGGLSEKPTNQDAIHALNMAIRHNPNNLRYYFDLANVFHEMKQTQASVATLEKAMSLGLELHTKEELELIRRCRLMLQGYTK